MVTISVLRHQLMSYIRIKDYRINIINRELQANKPVMLPQEYRDLQCALDKQKNERNDLYSLFYGKV